MNYIWKYKTPESFSDMWMASNGDVLTKLDFFHDTETGELALPIQGEHKWLAVFSETEKWLDRYFSGIQDNNIPKYIIENATPFRQRVMDELIRIPYGSLVTYGDIAGILAKEKGVEKMSAQAVGNAVGWNPLCILIPCHRVIGHHKALTGYGGGMKNKMALLTLEGHDLSGFKQPKTR